MAVSPLLSTALTSAPRSSSSFDGFDRFVFGSRRFVAVAERADAGRGQQRRAVVGVRQLADRRPARAAAASAARRDARAASRNGVEPVVVNRPRPDVALFEPSVDVGAVRDELPDEVQAAQVSRADAAAGRRRRESACGPR